MSQDAIGDGGLYSIWAGVLALDAALLILISRKGAQWRDQELSRKLGRQLAELAKRHDSANGEQNSA